MKKTKTIWILGASSEIGNAYANLEVESGTAEIVRVGRIDSISQPKRDYIWDPADVRAITHTLKTLQIKKNDEVVIATGFLGTYGGWGFTNSIKEEEIIDLVSANLVAPTVALLFFIRTFSSLKGGRIVLLGSLAAHPVLDANPIYGQMKRFQDDLARSALRSRSLRKQNVDIVIARIGFVSTKLNLGRSSGGFSTSLERVSRKILQKKRGVVWSPNFGRAAIGVKFLPFGNALASKILAFLAN